MTDNRRVLLPIADAQKLLEYLTLRPFKEVHQLVSAITNAPMGEIQQPPIAQPGPSRSLGHLAPPELADEGDTD